MAVASHSKCDGLSVPVQVRPPAPFADFFGGLLFLFLVFHECMGDMLHKFYGNIAQSGGEKVKFGAKPAETGSYTLFMVEKNGKICYISIGMFKYL